MSKHQNLTFFLFLAAVFYLLSPKTSYAYLDPGTGSYIVQIVLAGLLSVTFMLKNFWRRLFNIIGSIFSRKKVEQEIEQDKNVE